MNFFYYISFFLFIVNVSSDTTTLSPHTCQNGRISTTPCKSGFLGRKSCDNSALTCEGGKYCCESISTTKRGATSKPSTSPSPPQGSININNTSTHPPTTSTSSTCSKCDAATRNECFRSIHNHNDLTLVNACKTCHGCCGDAFSHTCEVWRNKDFCRMEWYSHDKKLILCGKTCGFC